MLTPSLRCATRPRFLITSRSPRAVLETRRAFSLYDPFRTYVLSPSELNTALQKSVHSRLSSAPRVIPLCASWFLPNDGRNGKETYLSERIPNARFFDLDAVKDDLSPYPHMLPSATGFANAMRRLGIRRDDTVVVYDSKELGVFSAPRVGWTLQVFGHPNVHILNNFRKWVNEGYPTESGEPKPWFEVDYTAPELDEAKVVAFEEVRDVVKELGKEGTLQVQILDARSTGRWKGTDPEPREGLSSGHIPHSISMPASDLLHPDDKTLLPSSELQAIFESKGIDPSKPIISSCGTGVTAAIIDLALSQAGYSSQNRRLYDGSWTEWAQRVQDGGEGLIHTTS